MNELIRQRAGRGAPPEPPDRLEAAARRAGSRLSSEDITKLSGIGPATMLTDAELDREIDALRREIPAAFESWGERGMGEDLGGRRVVSEQKSMNDYIREAAGRPPWTGA